VQISDFSSLSEYSLPICLPGCMCTYLPIHLSSTYSPFCLFTCLYVQMSAFSFVCLFTICPFTCLPIHLPSCALVYTFHLSKFPSVGLTTYTSSPVLTTVDPPFCHCTFRRSIAVCWLSDCQLSSYSPLCFHLSACQPVLLSSCLRIMFFFLLLFCPYFRVLLNLVSSYVCRTAKLVVCKPVHYTGWPPDCARTLHKMV
jgi:hypothetical protein